jgi:hypothetical protein
LGRRPQNVSISSVSFGWFIEFGADGSLYSGKTASDTFFSCASDV